MALPTNAELNGRALYLVITEDPDGIQVHVEAVDSNGIGFERIANDSGGLVIKAQIIHDGREYQEEK